MATGNFRRLEASYIYVPKGWDRSLDGDKEENWFDILINSNFYDILNELRERFNKMRLSKKVFISVEEEELFRGRDIRVFGRVYILYEDKEKDYIDEAIIYLTFNLGYYEAGNLDYTTEMDFDDEKLNKLMVRVKTTIEKVYRKFCDVYKVSGIFSSGETMYHKVKI